MEIVTKSFTDGTVEYSVRGFNPDLAAQLYEDLRWTMPESARLTLEDSCIKILTYPRPTDIDLIRVAVLVFSWVGLDYALPKPTVRTVLDWAKNRITVGEYDKTASYFAETESIRYVVRLSDESVELWICPKTSNMRDDLLNYTLYHKYGLEEI